MSLGLAGGGSGGSGTTTSDFDHSPIYYAFRERYSAAYAFAKGLVKWATIVRNAAIIIGVLFAGLSIYCFSDGGFDGRMSGAGFLIFAVISVLSGFIASLIIAAIGQMMLCTIDTAVNTTPLLGHAQKADIMEVPQLG